MNALENEQTRLLFSNPYNKYFKGESFFVLFTASLFYSFIPDFFFWNRSVSLSQFCLHCNLNSRPDRTFSVVGTNISWQKSTKNLDFSPFCNENCFMIGYPY